MSTSHVPSRVNDMQALAGNRSLVEGMERYWRQLGYVYTWLWQGFVGFSRVCWRRRLGVCGLCRTFLASIDAQGRLAQNF